MIGKTTQLLLKQSMIVFLNFWNFQKKPV